MSIKWTELKKWLAEGVDNGVIEEIEEIQTLFDQLKSIIDPVMDIRHERRREFRRLIKSLTKYIEYRRESLDLGCK